MLIREISILLFASFCLVACKTNPPKDSSSDRSTPLPSRTISLGSNDKAPPVGSAFRSVSGKTARFITRQQLFQLACSLQSDNHNEQRLTVSIAPPIVLIPNAITGKTEAVKLDDTYQTKVYDSKTAPFDMTACLVQASVTGWERTASVIFKDFGISVIRQGTKLLVGKEIFGYLKSRDESFAKASENAAKNAKPSVNGDNNRVVVGNDNTYNEAGGIPAEPLSFAEVELGSKDSTTEPETEVTPVTDEASCLENNGIPIFDEPSPLGDDDDTTYDRCSDGGGRTL